LSSRLLAAFALTVAIATWTGLTRAEGDGARVADGADAAYAGQVALDLAALILASHDPSPAVRRKARAELDARGLKSPGDCVQTKDNGVLAAVLGAYGATRDADALPVVLSFVGSDRTPARNAARSAVAAYGDGALGKLREAYANLLGKPAPSDWSASQIAGELFAAYDKLRLQDVDALTDQGLAELAGGKPDLAVADFDKVLARQPTLERRIEMVPGYVTYALSIEETDHASALAYLQKALVLLPDGPRAGQIRSEIAYIEGEDLLARGIVDADLFKRAALLDPGNEKARQELARIDAAAQAREERIHRWAIEGAAAAIVILGIALFGSRARRARDL
jgi:tetratricopeptide (TPR) repeat protein